MEEMEQLKQKAIGFIEGENRRPCREFYRDKDKEYYDQCLYENGGFLLPTLKNENGDPASPINSRLEGIFLSVGVDWKTQELPRDSPYGNIRFQIPIEWLYGPYFNLYFADFYCHAGSKSHRLTLVLTRPETDADNFCASHLPKLNRSDNPFLWHDGVGWVHNTSAWIHVFYTERIPIKDGRLYQVCCDRPSTNLKWGKPKNPSCETCSGVTSHSGPPGKNT